MIHFLKTSPRRLHLLFPIAAFLLAAGALAAGTASAAGEEHRFIPAHSQVQPEEACGVAVDSAGDLYVSRPEEFLIQVFGPAGEPITEFEAAANAGEPCGLAVDSSGAVYVNDIEGAVVKYAPEGGEFPPAETTGYEVEQTAGDEGLIVEEGAQAIALDPGSDDLYVAEGPRISRYEADGTAVTQTIGTGVAGASYAGVGVYGANGHVYAVDAAADEVYVFDAAGSDVEAAVDGTGNPSFPSGFGNLNGSTLAVDQANGNFFVNNERANFVVAEFTASGTFVSQIGPWVGTGKAKLGASPNGATVTVDNGSSSPNAGDVYVPGLYFELPVIYSGVYAFEADLTPTPSPAVANADPASITKTGALIKGSVDNEGAQSGSSCKFVLAPASAPATPIAEPACNVDPVAGDAGQVVQAVVSGLTPGTEYVYGVVATNAGGTSTATPAKAFSTESEPPIVPNPDPALIARWEPCEPDTGVTVIVDRNGRLGDGRIYVGCALGEQESGLAALHNAGFATVGVGGGEAFVCRIDGLPTPAEEDCAQTPGADRYWSYWHGFPGGRWGYSGFGATSPLSRAPINSVEGWGFGRSPRIEPMDGAGPSAFLLPPEQESSAIPAALAREWLRDVTATSVERALTPASGVSIDVGELLAKVIALRAAGVPAGQMAAARQFLTADSASGTYEYTAVELWANSLGTGIEADPEDPTFPLYGTLARYTQAVLAAEALGGDPGDFAALDLRDSLVSLIDEATGKLRHRSAGGGEVLSEEPGALAAAVNALAATGPLPAKALKSVDLLVAQQDPTDGGFGLPVGGQALAIRALSGAREKGADGLDGPLAEAGQFVAGLQEPDGSVRASAGGGAGSGPTFAATAAGAVGLALAGFPTEAELAAKRLSRFQVIAAYVGAPDPSSGETAPAEPLIGAFLPTEADLRHVLAHGLPEDGPHGPYNEAHLPTAQALEALELAGPYGPHSASLSRGSLWFGKQAVGARGAAQTAALTNEDERPLSVAAVDLVGAAGGDFVLDGADCLGRTLAFGQSCGLAVGFAPTAVGVREALVRVELAGSGQTFELAVGGTGVPGPVSRPEPQGGPGPLPKTQLSPPPGAESILMLRGSRRAGRVVPIARLSCPAGGACRVKLPRRVGLTIAGRRYRAAVLAPRSLEGGASAILRLRLSKQALAALDGGRATIKLKIEILNAGGSVSRTVEVRVGGRGSP